MNEMIDQTLFPEIVIGISGPVGIDIEMMYREIASRLKDLSYTSVPIHITKVMMKYQANGIVKNGDSFFDEMSYKMDYANQLCSQFNMPDALMRMAIQAIRLYRVRTHKDATAEEKNLEDLIIPKTAYIIRQLKRPEEVALLRETYGKNFILISGYASPEDRKKSIAKKIKESCPSSTVNADIFYMADKLIDRDQDESSAVYGQHLRETFHLADVFIDGLSELGMRSGLERFFNAFFGKTDIAPTKHEYGMYSAKAASLRSSDLSRQVGAAIYSDDGELITQGCNEVPKAFGGTYWDGESPDHRDIKMGFDPNDLNKKETIREFIEILIKHDLLDQKATCISNSSDLVSILIGKSENKSYKSLSYYGSIKGSSIDSLTEYGRVVHAEMCAICDAARLGRSIKGATLYCTTFPCHNCTKHILACGIKKVIYIEPYPKSRAKDLHPNEIELENESASKVSYIPFLGISPHRYRDIFQKGSRKIDGRAKIWINNEPRPMIDVTRPTYIDAEKVHLAQLAGIYQPKLI